MSYLILNRDDLPRDANTFEFEGIQYHNTEVSFIWVEMAPGGAVRLHKHPYAEVFIVHEGNATFTVGSESLQAHAGQIIIVPADTPHKFMSTGDQPLRQIDIHVSMQFVTEWLED